jgi:hypothetical protein
MSQLQANHRYRVQRVPLLLRAHRPYGCRINRACSDASYLKIAALCAPAFLLILFIPFMTLMGEIGIIFLQVAVPVWIALWCFRFLRIQTDDPDFRSAKKTVVIVAIAWVILVGLRFFA